MTGKTEDELNAMAKAIADELRMIANDVETVDESYVALADELEGIVKRLRKFE